MIRRPPRSTRTDTLFPTRRSSDLYGLATIYDLGILIYCASVLIEHKRRGANDIPQTLNVVPYDMLRTRSEEHTSELQSLMRISYAVFCLKKKKLNKIKTI